MTNGVRGEVMIETTQNGESKEMMLCVTTGALAQLETELGVPMSTLEKRIETDEMNTINSVIYWLLRGGGNDLTPEDMITLSFPIKPAVAAVKKAFEIWSQDAPQPKKD